MSGSSEDLVPDLRRVLEGRARGRTTIRYADLAAEARVPPPHKVHRTVLALEAMLRADRDAGRPPLAALAVSRAAGGIPGRGFFQAARDLGLYDGPDEGPDAARWHRELVLALWRDFEQGD